MNKLAIGLLMTVVAGVMGCGSEERPKQLPDRQDVLNSSPFQGITDSIRKTPDNPELLLRRAMLLSGNNLHRYATADYEKAWKLTGNEEIELMYISNLLLSDKVELAIGELKNGASKFPGNTEFNRRLGEVYLQQGQLGKALEQYDLMIGKDSSNFEAWYDRGAVLAKMEDTAAAIASYENSFSLLPINYTGLALADLYIARKDPRALEVCEILLSRDSSGTQTEPVYLKGVYYTEVHEYDKALRQFDECIRRDWKMTDAYIEKGIIFFERKKYAEAIKVFRLTTTVSNTDADAWYWLGRCYEAIGDREEATLNYERALSLDNGFAEARDGLNRLRL